MTKKKRRKDRRTELRKDRMKEGKKVRDMNRE
jgi:hypothetical protein